MRYSCCIQVLVCMCEFPLLILCVVCRIVRAARSVRSWCSGRARIRLTPYVLARPSCSGCSGMLERFGRLVDKKKPESTRCTPWPSGCPNILNRSDRKQDHSWVSRSTSGGSGRHNGSRLRGRLPESRHTRQVRSPLNG
jgi:hypothetical protein